MQAGSQARRQATKRRAPDGPPAVAARIVTADELGLLKVVEVPGGAGGSADWSAGQVVQTWGQPDKAQAIHALAAPNIMLSDANVLAVSRAGGAIQVLDALQGSLLCSIPAHTAPSGGGPQGAAQAQGREVRCLAFRHEPAAHSSVPLELASATTAGTVRLHRQQQRDQGGASCSGAEAWQEAAAFQAAPNVACMALDPSGSHVAVGGEGCHLRVWSLGQGQEVFRAKGGKPSRCGLVDLPHLTAATFLPDPSGQLVMVGTVKHKLWLYDMRAGKRPQWEAVWGDARVTALAADPDGVRVWAANGTGHIEALDTKARAPRGCLKGPAGSVRALALAPAPGGCAPQGRAVLASAGLDRFLRVHGTGAGQQALAKVYLKQQLTGVAWLRPAAAGGAAAAAGAEASQGPGSGQEQDGLGDGEGEGGSQGPARKAARGGSKQAGEKGREGKRKGGAGGSKKHKR